MCLAPDVPKPLPPIPAQAAPVAAVLAPVEGTTSTRIRAAARGRNALRIDKTQNLPGAAGSGLNIPT